MKPTCRESFFVLDATSSVNFGGGVREGVLLKGTDNGFPDSLGWRLPFPLVFEFPLFGFGLINLTPISCEGGGVRDGGRFEFIAGDRARGLFCPVPREDKGPFEFALIGFGVL